MKQVFLGFALLLVFRVVMRFCFPSIQFSCSWWALGAFLCGVVYERTDRAQRPSSMAYCGCFINPNGTIRHNAACHETLQPTVHWT
jgi:hypothetical protein